MEASSSVLFDRDAIEPHPQTQSILFSKLPPEIRNHIFRLALAPFEDSSHPYPEDAFYYRPGYTAKRRQDPNLLRTCRAIHLEAEALLRAEYEHTVWCGGVERAPPESLDHVERDAQKQIDFFKRSWYDKGYQMHHVRMFCQLTFLETGGPNCYFSFHEFCPEKITITVRHTDWFWWERDEDLAIKDEWVTGIELPNSVQVFSIEFETLNRKAGQLDAIVAAQARKWKLRRRDGVCLLAAGTKLKVSHWTGKIISPRPLGTFARRRVHHPPQLLSNADLSHLSYYYVLTVSWRLVGSDADVDKNPQKADEGSRGARPFGDAEQWEII